MDGAYISPTNEVYKVGDDHLEWLYKNIYEVKPYISEYLYEQISSAENFKQASDNVVDAEIELLSDDWSWIRDFGKIIGITTHKNSDLAFIQDLISPYIEEKKKIDIGDYDTKENWIVTPDMVLKDGIAIIMEKYERGVYAMEAKFEVKPIQIKRQDGSVYETLSVVEFNDGYSHIISDDNCWLIVNGGGTSKYIFDEAMGVLRFLPDKPSEYQPLQKVLFSHIGYSEEETNFLISKGITLEEAKKTKFPKKGFMPREMPYALPKEERKKAEKYWPKGSKKEILVIHSEKEKKKDEKHKYGCMMVYMPKEIADAIRNFAKITIMEDQAFDGDDAPGKGGYQKDIHATVKFGLFEKDPKGLVEHIKPCKAKLGPIKKFADPKKPYDVIVCHIDSPELYEMNYDICDNFDNVQTYKYDPHVTLAYVKTGECEDLIGKSIPEVTDKEIGLKDFYYSTQDGKKFNIDAETKEITDGKDDED